MRNPGEHLEPLSKSVSVIVSQEHRFNTDTLLLAHFSMPRKREICADLGTGCGTIPLIWCARGNPSKIFAVEIQPEAASLAERSAKLNGLEETLIVLCQDLKTVKGLNAPRGLDLVVCNPPYKPHGTGHQNPHPSLRVARHEASCNFFHIADAAARLLRFGGKFCCCLRPERLTEVLLELHRAGLEPKNLRFVQQRAGKEPSLFLLQALKGGKPGGLRVQPTLCIESAPGVWSEEMLSVYGEYKDGYV